MQQRAIVSILWLLAVPPAAAANGGDLKMDYHVILKNRAQVTAWGYQPGWGRSIDVQQYTEGTLVVDLIDSATDKLVWRGSATDVASDSPQTNEKRINDAMEKLFKKYPPPGK